MNFTARLRQTMLEKMISYWAPYLGAGVKLKSMSKDYRHAVVEMPLTFYNKNYVGTHFGGSLYSMVDPWYMLMLIKNLGAGYIVWDKAATIHFRKPGQGKVTAEFKLDQETIDHIKASVEAHVKMDQIFKVEIKDESGRLIAEVEKVLYIRKKN